MAWGARNKKNADVEDHSALNVRVGVRAVAVIARALVAGRLHVGRLVVEVRGLIARAAVFVGGVCDGRL
eukprot:4953838-Heterocapsa_arctica.AAC.1